MPSHRAQIEFRNGSMNRSKLINRDQWPRLRKKRFFLRPRQFTTGLLSIQRNETVRTAREWVLFLLCVFAVTTGL
jgi:hypothetical protein